MAEDRGDGSSRGLEEPRAGTVELSSAALETIAELVAAKINPLHTASASGAGTKKGKHKDLLRTRAYTHTHAYTCTHSHSHIHTCTFGVKQEPQGWSWLAGPEKAKKEAGGMVVLPSLECRTWAGQVALPQKRPGTGPSGPKKANVTS